MSNELSSDIILNILSRLPVKSLARYRCVSKLWCKYIDDNPYFAIIHGERAVNEPMPFMYRNGYSHDERQRFLRIHMIEAKECTTVFKVKTDPFLEFGSAYSYATLHGTCNGLLLLFLSQNHSLYTTSSLVVFHPLRKEYYELPPIDIEQYAHFVQCGLGFDTSTNTFKMVFVFSKNASGWLNWNFDLIRKNLCTVVHVLGTDSWREIPQVPYYPITGEYVFAHGCLHWLVVGSPHNNIQEVICFDVIGEEFGLISPPEKKGTGPITFYYLIDLHGEVGYVHQNSHKIEVWVLKMKEWMMHFQLDQEPSFRREIRVLCCWNQEGDILMKLPNFRSDQLFVYNLKSGLLEELKIFGQDKYLRGPKTYMYPSSLFSIRGITPSKIKN